MTSSATLLPEAISAWRARFARFPGRSRVYPRARLAAWRRRPYWYIIGCDEGAEPVAGSTITSQPASIDKRLAARMSRLGTESAFEVLARAKALEAQGRHVIHLEIGEPDFATPEAVVEAGVRALREGHTHYTPSPGIAPLREAVAAEMARTRGLAVSPE